jgi:hypothetical protein
LFKEPALCFKIVILSVVKIKILSLIGYLSLLTTPGVIGAQPGIPHGKIVDSVECINHPGQRYCLYISPGGEAPRPIIVFLEPGARGRLPVELYRGLADRYGFILACSNNGRNGPVHLYQDALDAMIPDLVRRFNPDTSRMILSGFSGGARHATVFSSTRPGTGVIACAAGNSPHRGKEQFRLPFYTGIVGRTDMNYLDVISAVELAGKEGAASWIVFRDGGHEWPDTLSFRRAMDIARIDWDNRGIKLLTGAERERIRGDMIAQLDEVITLQRLNELEVLMKLYRAHPLFDADDPAWVAFLENLPGGKTLEKAGRKWTRIRRTESTYIDTIRSAMEGIRLALYNQTSGLRPGNWWKGMGRKVKKRMVSDDRLTSESGARMYDLTWRVCWSRSLEHLENPNEYEQALRYMSAWCRFDPLSPEAYYWLAAVYAYIGENDHALEALGTAVTNGFTSEDRIRQTRSFKRLQDDPRYLEILQEIRQTSGKADQRD